MKDQIMNHLDNASALERLYRSNKGNFRKDFNSIYTEIKDKPLAGFWNERLNYEADELSWGSAKDLVFVIIISLIAGMIAKLPALFGIDEEFFYPRNIGFIVFPMLLHISPGRINYRQLRLR